MTPAQRLIALFDLAYDSHGDVVIWEHDEPDAPAALASWANGRAVDVVVRTIDIGASNRTLEIVKPKRFGRISVYCKRRERAA